MACPRQWLRALESPGLGYDPSAAPLAVKEPHNAGPRKRRRRRRSTTMTIKVTPNDKGNPAGKLAEAEVHFTDGPLAGLKLIGLSVWERRGGAGRNVTFPARSYSVNRERRSYALLRPIGDVTSQDHLRELILEAYAEFDEEMAGVR